MSFWHFSSSRTEICCLACIKGRKVVKIIRKTRFKKVKIALFVQTLKQTTLSCHLSILDLLESRILELTIIMKRLKILANIAISVKIVSISRIS